MKKTKQCPKCQSDQVIHIPGAPGSHKTGEPIPVGGVVIIESVLISRYLCGGCGYSEEWIDSDDDLAKVRERYLKD